MENLTRIASFSVNHDYITEGIYVSRIDGDITTYDMRTRIPNNASDDYMSNLTMHTFEHLFATYARNSALSDQVVYVGPMGCRTGFYLLVRDMDAATAIRLTRESLQFVADFEGELPGNKKIECGNYLDHDLEAAKKDVLPLLALLQDYPVEKLAYPQADQGV